MPPMRSHSGPMSSSGLRSSAMVSPPVEHAGVAQRGERVLPGRDVGAVGEQSQTR